MICDLSFYLYAADFAINSSQFVRLKIIIYATVLKAQASVGPIQIPNVPLPYLNTIKHVTGIPIVQYAKNVIIAPFYYLPEALTVEAAIP